jgi:hypothetical protein
VGWDLPTDRVRHAHANELDATRDGAYGVSLAACEVHLQLVAVARAENLTGADYYVGPAASHANSLDETLNLEDALRLEVSGIGHDERGVLWRQRLSEKIQQARQGKSGLPAIASVVVFFPCQVQLRTV